MISFSFIPCDIFYTECCSSSDTSVSKSVCIAHKRLGVQIPAVNKPGGIDIVTAPLIYVQLQVWMTQVLRDDHLYKQMHCVMSQLVWRVLYAEESSLLNGLAWVPSISQNLQSFTGNVEVSIIWVKNSWLGRKIPTFYSLNMI